MGASRPWAPCWLGVAAWLCCAWAVAEPLRVCVSQDTPPLSQVRHGQARGFDIRLAQAVAEASGRELKILPFETEFEKESTLAHEVNALLSAGLCDLVSGFPLLRADLGPPGRSSARPPDYPGAKRKRERAFITLGELVASSPYLASTLGVAQAAGRAQVKVLMDLQGRKTGAVSGTLAGTLVSLYRSGALRGQMVTLSQREDAWAALDSGRIDSLLLPTAAFDAYRLQHPATALELAELRRPIGLNLGLVALASAPQELLQVSNRVIAQAMADGRMQRWAAQEGLSWSPPTQPAVSDGPTLASLSGD
ncbi:MAG: transporter substrate-binding domain-containing protein [Betaproteobacteria bacterium]